MSVGRTTQTFGDSIVDKLYIMIETGNRVNYCKWITRVTAAGAVHWGPGAPSVHPQALQPVDKNAH